VAKVLAEGEMPEIPESIPRPLRKLILRCWDPSPRRRPQFKHVVKKLKRFLKKIKHENLKMSTGGQML